MVTGRGGGAVQAADVQTHLPGLCFLVGKTAIVSVCQGCSNNEIFVHMKLSSLLLGNFH